MADFVKIENLNEADAVLARMAEAQREIALVENALNEQIDRLKSEAQQRTIDHRNILTMEELRLKAYSKDNRKEFKGLQSLDLAHGTLGFRRSTALSLAAKGDTWEEIIARLEEGGHDEVIRRTKEADKDALKKWPEDRLQSFGLKLKETEKFVVEVKQEKVL
ncbi:MAG: host-nuclease inhibitor Gam family protein [Deltaproteobacteria bacterium]|jgi:phage host-nuclease inhibitor protein Gam|nr:host-nuclease inhibitor Gam family protein [Deltaproteobacteria bacterium]